MELGERGVAVTPGAAASLLPLAGARFREQVGDREPQLGVMGEHRGERIGIIRRDGRIGRAELLVAADGAETSIQVRGSSRCLRRGKSCSGDRRSGARSSRCANAAGASRSAV